MNARLKTAVDQNISPHAAMELRKSKRDEHNIPQSSRSRLPPLVVAPDGEMETRSLDHRRSPQTTAPKSSGAAAAAAAAPPTNKLNLDWIGFAGGLLWPKKPWAGLDTEVGPFLRQGTMVAFVLWCLGILLVYSMCPADSFEYLEGAERNANLAVLSVLLCTNISRFVHLIIRDKSFVFVNTGLMFGSTAVQLMAIASICLMVAFPTPVLIDPVTGLRSHMVRWVEWVVLAFLMTFLTESIDMPLKDSGGPKMSWIHGIAIGLSTAAGGIFPLCKSWGEWLTVFAVSWILFCSLFYRLYHRFRRILKMPREGSFDVKDEYERANYSLKTIAVCTVVWTLLAASFSVIAILKPLVPKDSFFASDSLVLVAESIFEIISKVWYLNLLVEVHNVVFDDASRTMRRLEELRVVMSTIWNTSSDVMVWCSVEDGHIHAVVSPSFFDFSDPPSNAEKLCRFGPNAKKKPTLILEVDEKTGSYSHQIIAMNLSNAVTRQDAVDIMFTASKENSLPPNKKSNAVPQKNIAALASLLLEAYRSEEKEVVKMTTMYGFCHDGGEDHATERRCEAKISSLDNDSSVLVVLRDISERFDRFEAEKRLVEERTARRKDAEANRFTRHEVKNSILAAIGVLETMRGASQANSIPNRSVSQTIERDDAYCGEEVPTTVNTTAQSSNDSIGASLGVDSSTFEEHAGELDDTLRTVLDTIMDHAMSREVIYEEYEVRRERIKVQDALSNIRRQANSSTGTRFSLTTSPVSFPILGLDPRLLRYIYQNALSNACRYGKRGGAVETWIYYEEAINEFRMEVINLPGVGHEELLQLTDDEVQERVFSQGSRLHGQSHEKHEMSESNSSGDGAWIMKKCAVMMKGGCDIRFEPDRTVFSCWCPAKAHISREYRERELIALPENTWGIVIDDSGIQRKLMDRYLKIAGISSERKVILGKDTDEIYGFNDLVVDLVEKNPEDKFLVIADENLDVLEGVAMHGTVSGSLCLEKILDRLDSSDSARVLALVRSANDSAKEADLYKSRAHGYLVKAPIDKNGVLKSIQPWWFKRFPPEDEEGFLSSSHRSCSSSMDVDIYDPFADIKAGLEVLTALSLTSPSSLRKRWRSIQDRLQALKGDLKSMIPRGGPDLNRIIDSIDDLRAGGCPDQLRDQWRNLQSDIDVLMESQRSNYVY